MTSAVGISYLSKQSRLNRLVENVVQMPIPLLVTRWYERFLYLTLMSYEYFTIYSAIFTIYSAVRIYFSDKDDKSKDNCK